MRETELKRVIDEETYERVKSSFEWDSTAEQVNNYYADKNGILRENRVMVRVRVIDGVSKIQVKRHKNENSPLQICEETEFDTEGVPDVIDSAQAKRITGMEVGALFRMGAASTLRHTRKRGGSELCLDKTTYFDKTDYEVEVEYEDKMSADLLMRLMKLGIEFNQSCVGKFSRFLGEYDKRAGGYNV